LTCFCAQKQGEVRALFELGTQEKTSLEREQTHYEIERKREREREREKREVGRTEKTQTDFLLTKKNTGTRQMKLDNHLPCTTKKLFFVQSTVLSTKKKKV